MCFWINTTIHKLLSDMRIPEVLDFVISPSWKMGSDLGPPEILYKIYKRKAHKKKPRKYSLSKMTNYSTICKVSLQFVKRSANQAAHSLAIQSQCMYRVMV